jgi:hypothetical protein
MDCCIGSTIGIQGDQHQYVPNSLTFEHSGELPSLTVGPARRQTRTVSPWRLLWLILLARVMPVLADSSHPVGGVTEASADGGVEARMS